tara:strand:- start:352 stop:681 length:330 start_codon:yes stop_codon:yes gene_type:complete
MCPTGKNRRSCPTKAIRMRFFAAIKRTAARRQDKNTQKDRAQKDPEMPAKHTCAGAGAHTAAATSDCSLVPFAGATLGALSSASLTAADAATAASAASAVLLMRVALGL